MENGIQKHVELEFSGVTLTCPIENGHRMVPVKTICQIIDVDYKTQDSWLKKHNFFGQLYRLAYTVGADMKERKMNCLSIFDVNTWLGSISLNNRRDGSIEKQYAFMVWLREQQLGIYKAIDVFMQENKYELQLIEQKEFVLNEMEETQGKLKDLKSSLKKINASIEDVREKRFTGQTALPFPDDEQPNSAK